MSPAWFHSLSLERRFSFRQKPENHFENYLKAGNVSRKPTIWLWVEARYGCGEPCEKRNEESGERKYAEITVNFFFLSRTRSFVEQIQRQSVPSPHSLSHYPWAFIVVPVDYDDLRHNNYLSLRANSFSFLLSFQAFLTWKEISFFFVFIEQETAEISEIVQAGNAVKFLSQLLSKSKKKMEEIQLV